MIGRKNYNFVLRERDSHFNLDKGKRLNLQENMVRSCDLGAPLVLIFHPSIRKANTCI